MNESVDISRFLIKLDYRARFMLLVALLRSLLLCLLTMLAPWLLNKEQNTWKQRREISLQKQMREWSKGELRDEEGGRRVAWTVLL